LIDRSAAATSFADRTPRIAGRVNALAAALIWPLVALIGVSVLWQFGSAADTSPARVIPMPGEVWAAFVRTMATLISRHIPTTLAETLIGLALAAIIGIALAALLDWSTAARRALYPLLIISQTIPIVAIALVLILLFGFGIGPKVVVVVLYCIFPITVNMLDGLTSTDPNALLLLQSFGATRGQMWWSARLPSSLPGLFSGLRIAATYSVTNAILGEYVSSNQGLGQYMRAAYASAHVDQAFVAVVITTLLSLGLVGIVAGIERVTIGWYYARRQAARWERVTGNF